MKHPVSKGKEKVKKKGNKASTQGKQEGSQIDQVSKTAAAFCIVFVIEKETRN